MRSPPPRRRNSFVRVAPSIAGVTANLRQTLWRAEMAVRGLDIPGRVTVDNQVLETGRDQVPFSLLVGRSASRADPMGRSGREEGWPGPPFPLVFSSHLQSGLRSAWVGGRNWTALPSPLVSVPSDGRERISDMVAASVICRDGCGRG